MTTDPWMLLAHVVLGVFGLLTTIITVLIRRLVNGHLSKVLAENAVLKAENEDLKRKRR